MYFPKILCLLLIKAAMVKDELKYPPLISPARAKGNNKEIQ
jgi:hypothetical protein